MSKQLTKNKTKKKEEISVDRPLLFPIQSFKTDLNQSEILILAKCNMIHFSKFKLLKSTITTRGRSQTMFTKFVFF